MAILTQSGRAAMAASIKQQSLHLAWGTGNEHWETVRTVKKTFVENALDLEHAPIKQLTLTSEDGLVPYVSGEDYSVDSVTGQLSRIATGAIDASAAVAITYTIATPPPEITATHLLNEVGRRTVDEVTFCAPHSQGELLVPTGRFTAVETPTNNLFLRFAFDFEDAPATTIRELGIVVGSRVDDSLPPGQRYFVPKDIHTPGILLLLEHSVPLIRTPATRETFSFVVTF